MACADDRLDRTEPGVVRERFFDEQGKLLEDICPPAYTQTKAYYRIALYGKIGVYEERRSTSTPPPADPYCD